MELKSIKIIKSTDSTDRVRLVGEVAYDNKTMQPEQYWFDVPCHYEESLSLSGNPWFVCLIPLAVTLGEPLKICAQVDAKLFRNIHELMKIWKCWYPHLHIVPIEADQGAVVEEEISGKTAAFFSGGIDSFFTVLRHQKTEAEDHMTIDDLLTVWGFDVPLDNNDAFRKMKKNSQKTAAALGKGFIDIATNLRETQWRKTKWGELSHGCALASTALLFENKYNRILIASTGGYGDLAPWGSHVLTDHLLSTTKTMMIHDGPEFRRIEKTALVIQSDAARRSLHVCWKSGSDENCSACSKCYRTMITLYLLGALERCTTFDDSRFNITRIPKVYQETSYDRIYIKEIRELALQKGERDVVRAIDLSLKHSDRLDQYLSVTKRIEKWLETKRLIWRWSDSLSKMLLADSIY